MMDISYCDNYAEMSGIAAQLFFNELKLKPDLLMCAATGNSPAGCYSQIADAAQDDPAAFDRLRVLQLDEWEGLSPDNPHSCRAYLQKHLLEPARICGDRFIGFNASGEEVGDECRRMQRAIDREGPIDFCILGLGTNGHLGFNEPDSELQANCHRVGLDKKTRMHAMVRSMKTAPLFGLTVGMKDILRARKIVLLITGSGKEKVTEQLLEEKISTRLPASFLWLHPDTECLIDRKSYTKV